ncbi:MAG: styrene monooxygenase/indole monooxygenase family protein, partial [Pseudomonadota bacterium]|nr:styrene monooxygenase/indole monooxygenase family protein [Pseudomonadota bacterium]
MGFLKVAGRQPWDDVPFAAPLRFDILPGVGDVFSWPFYTAAGVCRGFALSEHGGPFNAGRDRQGAAAYLEFAREATERMIPDNAFLFEGARIPDEGAWLYGPTEPTVRQPV